MSVPLVKVEIYEGKSKKHKKAILDGIHDALVTSFKIPDDDRNQRLYELNGDNFERRGSRSANFTIIEITVFKGRSFKAKKLLYAEIARNLSRNPGIEANDILIILNEQPLENWSVSGGKPVSEIDLGFNINV
jgi:phenylpyruvate tautomerase PptA (4-oxalocrotonate tautomerase family)